VLERIAQLASEMRARVDSLASQIDSATAEKTQRELENLTIAEKLVDLDAERNACEVRAGLLQFESEQARSRLTELDALLREARRLMDASRDRKAELSTALVKLQSDAEYLAQTCVNELSVQRPELMADATLPRVSGEELNVEEQACQEMRARLDAMGPVNMMALEEYKETADRQAFLDTQRKDLLDAIENTQATIKEIDTFSRQKFEEAFNKINENFQVTFKKLFGGGNAFMRVLHAHQPKYRHHEMARPRFARGKTVRDRSHQAANHRDERGGDMQPFRASHFFTAHEVRPDVENRERDRDKHSCGRERRQPAQDSNAQGLLHLT